VNSNARVCTAITPLYIFKFRIWCADNWDHVNLEIDRYIGRYLGFTEISVSAKTADIIGLSRCWQNAVIFSTHSDNLRKKAQRSKSRQLSYSTVSRCVFNHGACVGRHNRNKSIIGKFRNAWSHHVHVCVRINSRYTSGSFRSMKSLTGT